MNKVLMVILLVMFGAQSVSAAIDKGGLFIEPMLTYDQSDFDVNYPTSATGDTDGDFKGAGLAARLGVHVMESVFVGLDARYSKYDFNQKGESYNEDASGNNYGAVIGLQLPTDLSVRAWWTYVLGGSIDPDGRDDMDVKFEDGHGYRIGAGIMIGTVSLNLEYQDITYDTTKLERAGIFSVGEDFSDVEMDTRGYVASISFPYAL